ncbi:MAG: hypothetical protein NVSMB32_13710 [Actinomycetota bacterium]
MPAAQPPEQPADHPGATSEERLEIALAIHEAHRRISANSLELLQASSNALGLGELLIRKGMIGLDELDRSRRAVEDRLQAAFAEGRLGVQIANDAPDKFSMTESTVEIDCEARLPLCRAACCRLRFPLSEQDIHEGVVQWNLAEPYLNRQTPEGYCVHCNVETKQCGVYGQRPAICRSYDCRNDRRIWLNFEKRTVNPDLFPDDPPPASLRPSAAVP